MRHRNRHLLFVAAACAQLAPAPRAEAQAEPTSVRSRASSVLAGDPRLDRHLTLSEPRLYLGELLDRLSQATGAGIDVDDRAAPNSGRRLAVVARDRAARDLMEAVAALYDGGPDRWYWSRERRSGKSHYVLRRTLGPGALRDLRRQAAEDYLISERKKQDQFEALPEASRKAIAMNDPLLAAINTPRNFGFHSFLRGMTDQRLRSIFRGETVEIPVSTLAPEQREFISNEYRMSNLPAEQAQRLENVKLSGGGLNDPSIWLDLGRVGSHAILGGIWSDAALRDHAAGMWPGKGKQSEAPEMIPAAGERVRPEDLQVRGETWDRILYRVAGLGRLDLLFDCPADVHANSHSTDVPLQGELSALLNRLKVLWSRKERFVLVRPGDWPDQDRGDLVPWPVMRELRETAAASNGFLRQAQWLRMAELTPEQLDRLSVEFPDASQVRNYQLLLRLFAAMKPEDRAAAARQEGAGWDDWSPATRDRLAAALNLNAARQARVMVRWQTNTMPPSLELYYGPASALIQPRKVPFRPRVTDADRPRPFRRPGAAPG